MPTLVLPPRPSDDCTALQEAALRAGWSVYLAPGWRLPEDLHPDDPAVYADPLFADVAAAWLDMALIEPPFDFLAQLPEAYRLRWAAASTLGEARQRSSAPFFAKPGDDKCFPARVYSSGTELPGEEMLSAETPVILSEPVIFEVEYRCFVQERTIAAISPYFRAGELAQAADGSWPAPPEEQTAALEFAAQLLGDASVSLPPAFVLDVGLIRERGWAVVEANPAWGAGIYGCDADAVLPVVQRTAQPRSRVYPNDGTWLRPAAVIEE